MTETLRVLYVDDEPALLELGKLFLEANKGFSVVTIDSAQAALTLLTSEKLSPDIAEKKQFPFTCKYPFGLEEYSDRSA